MSRRLPEIRLVYVTQEIKPGHVAWRNVMLGDTELERLTAKVVELILERLAERLGTKPAANSSAVPGNRFDAPAMMTAAEAIAYLRLDVDDRDPAERLPNLVRRQGLPVIKRGRSVSFAEPQWMRGWTSASIEPCGRQWSIDEKGLVPELGVAARLLTGISLLVRRRPTTTLFIGEGMHPA